MSKANKQGPSHAGNVFRFTLPGLIIFSLALMAGSAGITWKLILQPSRNGNDRPASNGNLSSSHVGPWGDLITSDIELERPAEYLTAEVADPEPEIWTFNGLQPNAAEALLVQKGLTPAQAAAAFAPGNFTANQAGTELKPSAQFLLSLPPETRQKLYPALASLGINLYLDYPYIFPGDTIESIYTDARLNPDDLALLKKLVYLDGDAHQLADYSFLLCQIPTLNRRVALAQALSRQSAVLARLAIHPDSDIDKIADYWGKMPGVHFTDIRPLLESLKALPEGGSISLLYLLPKFARDRLYTFPLPPQSGEPTMDCHWSTFNFCNDTPDNRFNDPSFAVDYIRKNFYQIAAPSVYGDIVLLMNDRQEIKHSAVYLADGLVFTKNGNNYRQPWMLMHISDLLDTYPDQPTMKVIYMRRKSN